VLDPDIMYLVRTLVFSRSKYMNVSYHFSGTRSVVSDNLIAVGVGILCFDDPEQVYSLQLGQIVGHSLGSIPTVSGNRYRDQIVPFPSLA